MASESFVSMKFEGGSELARNLDLLGAPLAESIKVDALTIAAEPMRDRMERLAPVSFEGDPHMADNIVIGTVSSRKIEAAGRQGETVIEVGPRGGRSGNDFFYSFFVEYGTAHAPAQPFARPAFEQTAPQCLEILGDELWFAVRRKLPAGEERFV